MKKFFRTILLTLGFFLFSSLVFGKVQAANLKFDAPSVSATAGNTFDVDIIVDTGGEEIYSIDAYISFDSDVVEAQSVSEGTFFPTVLNDITEGRVYVAGLVDDAAGSKSGTGTVATITFKALASGSTTLTYECDPSVNETSKVVKNDIDATNIITCSENGSTSVSVSGSSTATIDEDSDGDVEEVATGGVEELPESGIFDNIVKYAVPGVILFIIGLAVKLLL